MRYMRDIIENERSSGIPLNVSTLLVVYGAAIVCFLKLLHFISTFVYAYHLLNWIE